MANKIQALIITYEGNKLQRPDLAQSIHHKLAEQSRYCVFPVNLLVGTEEGHSNRQMTTWRAMESPFLPLLIYAETKISINRQIQWCILI